MASIDCRPSAQDLSQDFFFFNYYSFLKPDCGGTLPPCCLLGMDLQRQSSVFVSGRLSTALDVSTSPSAGRTSLSSPTTDSRRTRRPLLCLHSTDRDRGDKPFDQHPKSPPCLPLTDKSI